LERHGVSQKNISGTYRAISPIDDFNIVKVAFIAKDEKIKYIKNTIRFDS
jgi:hypothetical protein